MVQIYDNLFPPDLVRTAAAQWPDADWPHWLRYDSRLERKRVCEVWAHIPPACAALLGRLLVLRPEHLGGTWSDAELRGAGMHDMRTGDYLSCHLDASHHAGRGWERRASVVLFLEGWDRAWGGLLEFWAADLARPENVVALAPGRVVVFSTTDTAYHRVTPLECPPDVARKTLAAFRYGPATTPVTRPRACFVALPGEPADEELERLRAERGGLS